METKFTKGKWYVSKPYQTITDEKGFSIAQESGIRNSHEWQANALLISKAPEMFEMLVKAERTLREVYDCDTTELKQLLKEATKL